jgi:hypothetical protein
METIKRRIAMQDYAGIEGNLDEQGWAHVPSLLSTHECQGIASLYSSIGHFRSQVHMARHGFGKGEYRYFSYPLPPLLTELRSGFYPHLAPIASRWHERMRVDVEFPSGHEEFLERCHAAGQLKPTPLLLRYGPGDFNCLHQDLYGEYVFPLQMAILLSDPDTDFSGGEFVVTEQRPRMQSRVEVVPLMQGDAVIFAVNARPIARSKGDYRVKMRHGVSTLRRGLRHSLGIIFHDAT